MLIQKVKWGQAWAAIHVSRTCQRRHQPWKEGGQLFEESKCKGSELRMTLVCSRNSKAGVVRASCGESETQ